MCVAAVAVRKWVDAAYQLELPSLPGSSSSHRDGVATTAGAVLSLSATGAAAPRLSPKQLNDRLRQHTQRCTVCSNVLAGLKTKLQRAQAAAAACVAGLMGLVGSVVLPQLVAAISGVSQQAAAAAPAAGSSLGAVGVAAVLLGVGTVVAMAAAKSTAELIDRFVYVEFTHSDNH